MDEEQSNRTTQCQQIIEYLKECKTITTSEAMYRLGIARLASRIHDLRQLGYPIADEWGKKKNRYGRKIKFKIYRLEGGSDAG